jgi:hypothetical protein
MIIKDIFNKENYLNNSLNKYCAVAQIRGYTPEWRIRMKIKSDYMLREVAGTHVVVPTGRATVDFTGMISLNAAGAFLWKLLAEGKSEQELLAAMLEEYDVESALAAADISDFLETVKAADLLE